MTSIASPFIADLSFLKNTRLFFFVFYPRFISTEEKEKLQQELMWHDARKVNREDVKLNERTVELQTPY